MKRIALSLSMMIIIALTGTAASGQTVLTDVWKDKDRRGAAQKVSVFWITQAKQNRLLAENEFIRQLKARGSAATPFYVIIEPDRNLGRDATFAKIRSLGIDAVLTLRATDRQTAQTPIPAPGTSGQSPHSGFYQYVYDAPVVDPSGPVYLESILFDVASERRIWAARSVTKVDVIDQKALADFIAIMIDRLVADGMIP